MNATRNATAAENEKADPKNALVERGRYLAHDVASCVYCHSPRNSSGDVIRTRIFEGAPLPIGTPPGEDWAVAAPNLKSIAQIWGEKELITFLKTGVPPRGVKPRLPMPPFRMNDEDAAAVAAYLRSLR
ncbi:MAG TPA: c-type cytochrome [Planctomicrobium sp.]|nr:c-type cytochrome [Planctomicrobium sp.]